MNADLARTRRGRVLLHLVAIALELARCARRIRPHIAGIWREISLR